jgi:phosphoserine phosphatase
MRLPSWRPGVVRDALLAFVDAADSRPVEERVAVFDNDGTLWCEKPNYVQLDFMIDGLRRAVGADPALAERDEYRALLEQDRAAQSDIGLERIAFALLELCVGIEPADFDALVRAFFERSVHPQRTVPYRQLRYRPMLELLDELRAHDFSVFIVSGGGTEFVRAISDDFYGIEPQDVVGSLVCYEFVRSETGTPRLLRTLELFGEINEGPPKVTNIQRQLGRRPIFAAGNSPGDTEMLEYALAAEGPSMAITIDHDDAEREYAYAGVAGSFETDGSYLDQMSALGVTVVSMRDDWASVFADDVA